MQKVLLAIIAMMVMTQVQAGLIYSGDFTATTSDSSDPWNTITGSWVSEPIDLSGVNPVGPDTKGFALASFTVDPNPLGSTAIDSSDMVLAFIYFNGNLQVVGLVPATGCEQAPTTERLCVVYTPQQLTAVLWSIADVGSTIQDRRAGTDLSLVGTSVSGSWVIASVPEPGTLGLFGLGLLGLLARWKRVAW